MTAIGYALPEMECPHIMFLGANIGKQRCQDNSPVGTQEYFIGSLLFAHERCWWKKHPGIDNEHGKHRG